MSVLSVSDLFSMTDSSVRSTVSETLVQQLKSAPTVRSIFFSTEPAAPTPVDPAFVDDLATAMVCSSISLSSLYGFSKCVDSTAAANFWQTRMTDSNAQAVAEGQALYAWAFPDHCRSVEHTFRDYAADNAASWGAELAAHVTADPFINTEILKIFDQPNWLDQLNLVFYKIQRLDAGLVDHVLSAWSAAYPDQGIVNTWGTRTFIPAQDFSAVPEQFIGAVNAAISVRSVIGHTYTPGQGGPSASPGRSWDRYGFGVGVQQFLGGKPKALGLTTGSSPDNDPEGGSGCFVPGTPVRLADGSEVAIESIKPGDAVLGRDGRVAIQSGERVVLELEHGEFIYGIDDGTTREEPFFSAGHLFCTTEGWKAVDPAIALGENPLRDVGELRPGDVVFRLSSLDPVSYQEVRIVELTRRLLPPGSRLHGLHLTDGPPSYHARDYLVAMNYPVLTIERLIHGFGRLTEAERRLLESRLTEVMPLLSRAVGPFINTALQRALRASRTPASL